MRTRLTQAVGFAALLVVVGHVPAAAALDLVDQERACEARVAELKSDRDQTRRLRTRLVVLGAVFAAGASTAAAWFSGRTKRGMAASIGILAAAATGWTQTLPDLAELQERVSRATRHQAEGLKVSRQLDLQSSDAEAARCYRMFVSARFSDCASEHPGDEVPDTELCQSSATTAQGLAGDRTTRPAAAVSAKVPPARIPIIVRGGGGEHGGSGSF